MCRQQAAEVLRPWAVYRAVDYYSADLAGVQFLRVGRKAEKPVDLSLGEKFDRPRRGTRDPVDILDRIKPLSLPKTLFKLTRGLRRNQNIIAA
jgi:hypothetical protein